MDILQTRKQVNQKLAQFEAARKSYRRESLAVDETEMKLSAVQEAQELAQQAAQQVQQLAHNQIAGVVSRCLEAIFDDPYEFKIIFERKRGRTEARLVFERDGVELDPLTASGGGIVDVGSFALRLSCLMLSQPPLRRLLILDEPFKFLSEEYRDRVRILLESLAKDMGVQFIMVTHIDELKTGKVVQL